MKAHDHTRPFCNIHSFKPGVASRPLLLYPVYVVGMYICMYSRRPVSKLEEFNPLGAGGDWSRQHGSVREATPVDKQGHSVCTTVSSKRLHQQKSAWPSFEGQLLFCLNM